MGGSIYYWGFLTTRAVCLYEGRSFVGSLKVGALFFSRACYDTFRNKFLKEGYDATDFNRGG